MPHFFFADNQAVSCMGIKTYIQQQDDLASCLWAESKQKLIALLSENGGEGTVILDYALFDFRSVEEVIMLSIRYPQVHWLFFSNEFSKPFVLRLMAEERMSFLLKSCDEQEIRRCLAVIRSKQRYICTEVKQLITSRTPSTEQDILSNTEKEVLRLLVQGKTSKEIAEERHSSVHTIITHKKNIFRKIEVSTIHEATKYALRAGLVEMAEYYI